MIYLNVDNTEMILLKPTKKPLECQLKLNLNGKRIYQTSSSVKYLGIEIDQHLNWQDLFFHEHSRFTGQQGKGKTISSTPFYQFVPLPPDLQTLIH